MAQTVRDRFYPKAMLQLDEVKGLDEMMQDAIAFKYLTQPLTPQQVGELLQLPSRRRRARRPTEGAVSNTGAGQAAPRAHESVRPSPVSAILLAAAQQRRGGPSRVTCRMEVPE